MLVVEDNERLAGALARGLRDEGYVVEVCHDGHEAVGQAVVGQPDAIVLDVVLPGQDGLAACAEKREQGVRAPGLMLTSRDALHDRVAGLDAGADDYLVKPFELEELLARLRALLRRNGAAAVLGGAVLAVHDLRLDPAGRRVERAGRPLERSAREYALLEFLVRHAGEVLTRDRIAAAVWEGEGGLDSNVLDVFVHHLRAKLDRPFGTPLLHTVRGVGYVLREPSAAVRAPARA